MRPEAAENYDIAGAVSITAGLTLLVYALVETVTYGWGSTRTILMLAGAVALIVAFVMIEQRARSPLMPLAIFRNRGISSANAVGLLVGASLFSMFFFLSLYLQQVLRYSALHAGLGYLPLAIGIIVSAGGASVLTTRLGAKPVLLAGLVLIAAGLLMYSGVHTKGTYLGDVLPASLVVAIGLGFAFVPLTILAVSGVSDQESGLASGLINTAQQIGGAIGLAILATVAADRTEHGRPPLAVPEPERAHLGLLARLHGRRGHGGRGDRAHAGARARRPGDAAAGHHQRLPRGCARRRRIEEDE